MLTGMEELKVAGFQIRELPGLTDVRTQRPLNLVHHIKTPDINRGSYYHVSFSFSV